METTTDSATGLRRTKIREGARVQVTVSFGTPARRSHAALTDRIPAGLEPLNPVLATTGSQGQVKGGRSSYWAHAHQLRMDRAEASAAMLWEGVYEYSYVCRAMVPGVFVACPAKVEEQYQPEVFGVSGYDIVEVVA